MRPRTIVAVTGAVAALGLGAGGVAVATNGSAPAAPARPGAAFRANLAKRLGVSETTLQRAVQAARRETFGRRGRAVAPHRRFQTRRRFGAPHFGPAGRFGAGLAIHFVALQAEAHALGTDVRTLIGELHDGRSPAKVIAAHGKDPATVAQAIRTAIDRRVAGRVAARLTGTTPLPHRP